MVQTGQFQHKAQNSFLFCGTKPSNSILNTTRSVIVTDRRSSSFEKRSTELQYAGISWSNVFIRMGYIGEEVAEEGRGGKDGEFEPQALSLRSNEPTTTTPPRCLISNTIIEGSTCTKISYIGFKSKLLLSRLYIFNIRSPNLTGLIQSLISKIVFIARFVFKSTKAIIVTIYFSNIP